MKGIKLKMIENIGAYSQYDYNRGYQQGRSDGYSQAENDYFAQSKKDREDTYNCGYAIGRADAIEEFDKALRTNTLMPNWCYQLVRSVKKDLLKEHKNE